MLKFDNKIDYSISIGDIFESMWKVYGISGNAFKQFNQVELFDLLNAEDPQDPETSFTYNFVSPFSENISQNEHRTWTKYFKFRYPIRIDPAFLYRLKSLECSGDYDTMKSLLVTELNQDTGNTDLKYFFFNWNQFLNVNKMNFSKIYRDIMIEFSPIENTDRYSEIILSKTGSETDALAKTGKEAVTNTKLGKEFYERQGKETNETKYSGIEIDTHKESAFNTPEDLNTASSDSKQYGGNQTGQERIDKTTTSYGGNQEGDDRKDTKSWSNDYTDKNETSFENRSDTNTKTFQNRQDSTVEHTHGNIGVTQNSELVFNDMKIRLLEFNDIIIRKFLSEYCYLA